ncbi:hypothetical protein [Streptomyces sp. V1I1]|uniref:hypothetical protein n=1 Tax=Streptomyces sp. V1I1 TaxID=3042272 RepID=UPI002780FC14|nr:hypothetical protein [Streptomyces sp. V1I1]MDQ0939069.1 hypothetical protein [Streptomyces sp. V1I1]
MSVTDHRRLGVVAGAALLSIAVAGCSGLGRDAVGTISYQTEGDRHVMVSNPSVKGCHRLGSTGATEVTNNTLVDIVLYPNRDCSGDETTYLATTTSDRIAPRAPSWRSYTVVH